MGTNRHQKVLSALMEAIEKKYGESRIEELKIKFKPAVFESMDREIVCQTIAIQAWYRRVLFFVLYPRYILPYIIRIRLNKSAAKQHQED